MRFADQAGDKGGLGLAALPTPPAPSRAEATALAKLQQQNKTLKEELAAAKQGAAAAQPAAPPAAPASEQLKELQQRVKLQQAHVDQLEAARSKQPDWRLPAFESELAGHRTLLDGLRQQRNGLQPAQQKLSAAMSVSAC